MQEKIKRYRQYLEELQNAADREKELWETDEVMLKLQEERDRKIKELDDLSQKLREHAEKELGELSMDISEAEQLKQEILEEMRASGQIYNSGLKAKTKKKKSVNTYKVLEVLDGDFDQFSCLVEISQTKLKEYAKDHKDIKKPLENCIEVVSVEWVDLVIEEPKEEKKFVDPKTDF